MSGTQDKVISIKGERVVIKELSVAEIRQWLKEEVEESVKQNKELSIEGGVKGVKDSLNEAVETVASTGLDLIGDWLLDDGPLSVLVRMTDLETENLDHFSPRELNVVMAACKEVNSHFFVLRGKLMTIGEQILRDKG